MLRTLERILSMYPLGAFCCAVFQVGICEDVSSADIFPKQVWKLSELCSPAETSVDSAFYSPTDLRIAYPQQACICRFPPRVRQVHWNLSPAFILSVDWRISPAEFTFPQQQCYSPTWVRSRCSPCRVSPQSWSTRSVLAPQPEFFIIFAFLHFSDHCILKLRSIPIQYGALRHRKIQTYAFMC